SGQSHERSQPGNPVPALKEGKEPPRHKAPREPRAPWERRAHGPRSDSMSGPPQYLPTPDELVLVPPSDPHYPKTQKPQPKPGFISPQPPQPHLASIASHPSSISSTSCCTSSSDRGVSSSATPASLRVI